MAGACDTLGDRPRDRYAMLAALPNLFSWAEAQSAARGSSSTNQLDLFSDPSPSPPLEEDLREENAQTSFQVAPTSHSPYERYLRRRWERANLGVSFTESDDMDALVNALEASGGLRSRLVSTANVHPEHIGTTIHLVGLLCDIALLQGEDGETLAVGSLQDPHGTIELLAFPPNYKRHTTLWVEHNPVAVIARVQAHQDGELYLLCEHLAPFTAGVSEESYSVTIKTRAARGASAAPKEPPAPARPDLKIVAAPPRDTLRAPQPLAPTRPPAFTLIISIPDADEDQTVIDSVIGLKRLLEEYPGADTVTIRVPYIRGKWTTASLSWGVSYSHQLEARIRRLLGDDSIAVIQLAS
jgi:DNA polymerase III alpha subunit